MLINRHILATQFWGLIAIYTILGLMENPGQVVDTSHDLSLHFAGYVLLFMSARLAYRNKPQHGWLWLLLFCYSLGIETGQYFIPARTFDWKDLVANGTGLLLGLALWTVTRRIFPAFFRFEQD